MRCFGNLFKSQFHAIVSLKLIDESWVRDERNPPFFRVEAFELLSKDPVVSLVVSFPFSVIVFTLGLSLIS